MRRKIFQRFAALVATPLLAVALGFSLLWGAEPADNVDSKDADTPQSLLATYRAAHAAKDWRKCFLCYDEKMRADMFCCMLTGVAMCRDEELQAIVFEPLAGEFDDDDRRDDSHQPKPIGTRNLGIYRTFQKRADLPAVVAAAFRHTEATNPHDTLPEWGDDWKIDIDGDTAIGHWQGEPPLAETSDKPEQRPAQKKPPIYFRRVDGRWFLTFADPPPPLTASEREEELLAEIDTFRIELNFSNPAFDNVKRSKESSPAENRRELRMGVMPIPHPSDRTVGVVQLTESQARRLIEHLSTEGFLRDAAELDKQEMPELDMSQGVCALQVSVKHLTLHEHLGWRLPMLKRLDGIYGALDGEARHAVGALLAHFSEAREQWQASPPAKEPTGPAVNKQAAPNVD